MLNESRIDIYDYLYNIFEGVVTDNVYAMQEPQELTQSDAEDGFLVIRVGEINDESEFSEKAYGWARCYVTAYIPPISRGRLDYDKYAEYEDALNTVINWAAAETSGTYHIQEGSVLSADSAEESTANNLYFTFIKSFVVIIDKQDKNN